MSYQDHFGSNVGRCVEIRCHDGKVHRGYVDHCDNNHVYLRPLDGGDSGPGYGSYFFFGAALIAVAFASIAAFSYGPFFW
ncbi:hypothetical protein [Alkalihalobacillus sp. CinArs1]|uniref:hypothetical protein n=1 Tax=Alkalihalobacillus sp. CinArs1 TaxID=2995314 RepID=UPI0022DDF642|nr:hypothetical protein [Alkalihalobacillus sp. CinArs1]